jgi:thioredoxin-like negative regulator of GroEL
MVDSVFYRYATETWADKTLTRAQVADRIKAVPDLISALQAVLHANPDDDEEMLTIADMINRALNKAGV